MDLDVMPGWLGVMLEARTELRGELEARRKQRRFGHDPDACLKDLEQWSSS